MKFSKDNKPTEAGHWWLKEEGSREPPEPVMVLNGIHGLRFLFAGSEDEFLVSDYNLWGSRIEVPTVEVE